MDCAFSGVSKNTKPNSRSLRFPPMFAERTFIVCGFIFKSMMNLELIFWVHFEV